MIENQVTC